MTYCTIISTASSPDEADKLAAILLENKAAACVQMLPISSAYRWKGKIERSAEILMLIKTTDASYPRVQELIKAHHSYEVPEIIKLQIIDGLPEYLDWIISGTVGDGVAG